VAGGAGALEGVKVLDLSRIVAGPIAAQTLGDLGAEVIKVERPRGGDDARFLGLPALTDAEGKEVRGLSGYFLACNRNKKSVTADLSTPFGQEVVRRLALWADVVVENYKVGALARYGLDYASLSALKPKLIYCSITGYGQTGPLADQPGVDSAAQARSGMMSVTGEPSSDPQRVGVHVVDYMAGQNAVIAILAALRQVERGGPGQHLDIALLDTSLASMTTVAQRYLMSGEVTMRVGSRVPGSVVARLFDCQDGILAVSASTNDDYRRLCETVGAPELAENPRFATRAARVEAEAEIDAALEPIFRRRRVAEWAQRLQAASLVCAPVYSIDQALADPQAVARGNVVRAEGEGTPPIDLVASPLRMSATPVTRYAAPPKLGRHTVEVLTELGFDPEEIAAMREKRIV
jgi:crotonobetainyl-CoA:carnitine CoA-transferase CaiB-like acyl-CoA transferase